MRKVFTEEQSAKIKEMLTAGVRQRDIRVALGIRGRSAIAGIAARLRAKALEALEHAPQTAPERPQASLAALRLAEFDPVVARALTGIRVDWRDAA